MIHSLALSGSCLYGLHINISDCPQVYEILLTEQNRYTHGSSKILMECKYMFKGTSLALLIQRAPRMEKDRTRGRWTLINAEPRSGRSSAFQNSSLGLMSSHQLYKFECPYCCSKDQGEQYVGVPLMKPSDTIIFGWEHCGVSTGYRTCPWGLILSQAPPLGTAHSILKLNPVFRN